MLLVTLTRNFVFAECFKRPDSLRKLKKKLILRINESEEVFKVFLDSNYIVRIGAKTSETKVCKNIQQILHKQYAIAS